jgi:hypothetical protein
MHGKGQVRILESGCSRLRIGPLLVRSLVSYESRLQGHASFDRLKASIASCRLLRLLW